MEDKPLERLDMYLWAMVGIIVLSFVTGYILMPHVLPDDKKKLSFLQFVCGLGFQRYYRGRKDPPMTIDDFPTAFGTPTNNIELFAERLKNKWSPESKGSLRNACVRHMIPWWVYTHVFLGINRALGMLGATFITSCVINFLYSDVQGVGVVGYKLVALSALQSIAQSVTNTVTVQILAIAGTDPLNSGLQLTVLRKMHHLTLDCLISETSATEAQQMVEQSLGLATSLWGTPIKTCIIDFAIGWYALLQLYDLYGIWSVVLGISLSFSLTAAGAKCEGKKFNHVAAAYVANIFRQGVLNAMLDHFRALKLINWMKQWALGLHEQRAVIFKEGVRGDMWGALGQATVRQIEALIVLGVYFISVFVRGEKVSFHKGMMTWLYMSTVSGCFATLAGVRGSCLDIHFRCERLEHFLRLPVREEQKNLKDGPLQVVEGTFAWPAPKHMRSHYDLEKNEWIEKPSKVVLSGINLDPTPGELILVSGALSCGKTSLLLALLGELILDEGKLQLPFGRIGYQPQVPFLVEGSIRQNILFGIPDADCNEEHLQRALVASQLVVDMDDPKNTLHALRENSDVGRKGSHLSGGQRARTALARTIYACLQGLPLVLLDDPVASVDNEVVQAAWEDAILSELKDITRIIVVNSQLLERLAPSADQLVLLHQGKIAFKGTPSQAMCKPELLKEALGADFSWTEHYTARADAITTDKPKAERTDNISNPDFTGATKPETTGTILSTAGVADLSDSSNGDGYIDEADPKAADKLANWLRSCAPMLTFIQGPQPTQSLMAWQSSGDGSMPAAPLELAAEDWDMLWLRLRHLEKQHGRAEKLGKPRLSTIGVMWKLFIRMSWMLVLTGFMGFAQTYRTPTSFATVQQWESGLTGRSDMEFAVILSFQLMGFVCLEVATGFMDGLGVLTLSTSLRKEIDECLGYLAIPFFWKRKQSAEHHIRRVVNMDLNALSTIGRLPVQLVQTLITVALTARHAPILWVVMAISCFGYLQVNIITDWKNLQMGPLHGEVITRVFTRTLDQYDIIIPMRAMSRERHFDKMLHGGMMCKTYSNYWWFQSEHLIALLNTVIGSFFNMTAILIVIRKKREGAHAHDVLGFYFLSLSLCGMVQNLCNLYMPFNAQLKYYRDMEDLLCTPDMENEDGAEASEGWPEQGSLKFENIVFRYVPHAEPALRGVSFEVRPSEKLGIVGKTGSGKSTLVSLLLRLGPLHGVPPDSGGRVLLDGVDINTLKLDSLRKVVAVVPQEPTVFGAPLKINVGLEYTDAEVITALEWCCLDARQITNKGHIIEALWSNVHENLSVGEKQLLMAARALVRRPKVLILDECTAALDRETADKMLDAINTHSKEATVLSIAHRLRFVLKSDRILVLANGELAALDTVDNLLKNEDGYFATNLRLEQQDGD